MFKYQETFANELADQWLNGNREHVRTTIRNLKNKAQASYIAAHVAFELARYTDVDGFTAAEFVHFIHPNNV